MLSHFTFLRVLSWSELRQLAQFAWRRLNEEELDQVAGSLTFISVLALVPILTIAFAIFTTFPIFNTLRASLEAYFIQSLMPKAISKTILDYVTGFADKASGLSSVGAVFLFLTSVGMISTIDTAFNKIWRVKTSRPFLQRILVYWAIVTLGPLLIGISMTATSKLYMVTSGVLGHAPAFGALFYSSISVALSSVAFTLLYLVVPNRPVDWRDAAAGGILAGLAFEAAKRLFAAYITAFPTYAIIYGALAAIPVFLVWLYLSWFITLVGAVLVASLPVVRFERWQHVPVPGEAFVDAVALLDVLCHARQNGESATVNANTLRARTGLGFEEMELLLAQMEQKGWVGRVKVELAAGLRSNANISHWALVANPEALTLADVYRLFVFDLVRAKMDHLPVIAQVEAAIEGGLQQPLGQFFARLHLP
jgi:membrane protein